MTARRWSPRCRRRWTRPARPSRSARSTVLASLAAILLVPSPAFRSMAFGIMLSVVAVLAATLTLLPAVLGKLGTKINAGRIRLRREPRRRWREARSTGCCTPGASSCGAIRSRPVRRPGVLLLAAAPVIGMRTNMPSITIVPASANARVGYNQVTKAFGPGAPGTLQVLVPDGGRPRPWPPSRTRPGWPASSPARPVPGGPSTRWCPRPGPPPPRPAPPSTTSDRYFPPARSSAVRRPRTTTSSSRWLTHAVRPRPSSASSASSCC